MKLWRNLLFIGLVLAAAMQIGIAAADDEVIFRDGFEKKMADPDFVVIADTRLGPTTTVAIPLSIAGDVKIDWGGSNAACPTRIQPGSGISFKCEYEHDGVYEIRISRGSDSGPWLTSYGNGNIGIGLIRIEHAEKIIAIRSFGELGLAALNYPSRDALNLVEFPASIPSSLTDLTGAFATARRFNGDISGWDTSNVTSMNSMFRGATSFDGDLGLWDVSKVTDMSFMFFGATAFNQDIGNWQTQNVTSMVGLFLGATQFNQDIGGWNTSTTESMALMFRDATAFNQDLSTWETGSVSSMSRMFLGASAFNSDLSSWDVSSVRAMDQMFQSASSFNSNLGDWQVNFVLDMRNMFTNAAAFNQDLSRWCVAVFPEEPPNFAKGADSWTLPRPNWGAPCGD